MKKRNSGFTLTELLVILALMAAVGSYLVWNASVIFGYGARECHKKLASTISSTKVDTLGKAKNNGDIYLEISQNAKGIVYVEEFVNGESQGKTQISQRRVAIQYKSKSGGYTGIGPDDASTPSTLKIYFDRATGAILDPTDLTKKSKIDTIEVGGGKHVYRIKCWPETGKISY